MSDELPIFVQWLETLSWVVQTAEKFPKRVRGTLTDRLINLMFDVVEDFVEARYSKNKVFMLKRANLRLEKIRILLRIANEQKILSHQSYKHGIYRVNEVGKMLGGWLRQQEDAR
jgi:hypothetical protein